MQHCAIFASPIGGVVFEKIACWSVGQWDTFGTRILNLLFGTINLSQTVSHAVPKYEQV